MSFGKVPHYQSSVVEPELLAKYCGNIRQLWEIYLGCYVSVVYSSIAIFNTTEIWSLLRELEIMEIEN